MIRTILKNFGCMLLLANILPGSAAARDLDAALEELLTEEAASYFCTCCQNGTCKSWSGSLTSEQLAEVQTLGCDKEPSSVLEDALYQAVFGKEAHSRSRNGRRGDGKWECFEQSGAVY